MNVPRAARTALTFTTGFGLRDYLKRHKMAAGLIVTLIVLNEIRGIAVVWAILREWGWFQ